MGNTPNVRFKGFTEDWEQRKLGDLVIIERGGSPRPINKFITEDENGLNWVKIGDAPERGNYITQTKEKIRYEGLSKTREVHPGDLILSNSMSFGRPYIMAIDGCIHDGWLLIRDNEKRFDLKYLCYMLGTDMMLSQYKQMAAGSTVNNLNKELVGNTVVKYPSPEEQSKMGDYFSIFDHLITLHQQKCDETKEFKKYMLQNMFPQKDEKVPKIRFDGFTGDWEQRKLGDVAQEFKSGNSLKADEIDITGDYPVYGGNGLRGYTSTYNHDGEYALIGRQGALCGNMNYSVGKAYFTEHAVVVKADENNDTRYLYYMLDTMNLGQYSDQSAQPGLAVNKLVKLENRFPAKEEQQRIGWYFRNMDHLITLHQQKCNVLKEFKKYMLQNMFPQKGKNKCQN